MTMSQLPAVASTGRPPILASEGSDYVTMFIAGQLFGIPVLQVHDVLSPQKITRVPLAPPQIAGSLNLRGRIVTTVDVRTCLGLPPRDDGKKSMSIVVDCGNESFNLIVDQVGEVMIMPHHQYEPNPPTLDQRWRDVAGGVFRMDGRLMVVLDVNRLLSFVNDAA
ncbi:MAG: chemotaxis protein CheW [Alphaproteobacteria bacterium]|nr:chemotaxis protein CheW [Alphaproteobacteria bacterium]NDC56555.1 chemotaxis protein CheW [Alphaproteobacteria bacterium]NDG04546.1 chemotaxis protein CheW [Alphaproteobacteria bacterium]